VHPGETVIFRTHERFYLPTTFYGWCVNRVWGAITDFQVDSAFIDPGYQGRLQIAVTNNAAITKSVYQRASLCKVVFFGVHSKQLSWSLLSTIIRGPSREVPPTYKPQPFDRNDIQTYLDEEQNKKALEKEREKKKKRRKNLISVITIVSITLPILIGLFGLLSWLLTIEKAIQYTLPIIPALLVTVIFNPLMSRPWNRLLDNAQL